ncbi:hypothetical protein GDO78_014712 [Eleutherodactylus coqui]|uniref:Uncharacterized protein n=1 Tax=Eleutherodactylus coqui TaxID=57060 RepID=A0A8J6EP27_ELECQ|nr:hypothetical protein GDO78_014712 [Eleutherodactylus coqui]
MEYTLLQRRGTLLPAQLIWCYARIDCHCHGPNEKAPYLQLVRSPPVRAADRTVRTAFEGEHSAACIVVWTLSSHLSSSPEMRVALWIVKGIVAAPWWIIHGFPELRGTLRPKKGSPSSIASWWC